MLDYVTLWNWGAQEKAAFKARKPFPHVIIDNFLPAHILELACEGFPDPLDAEAWRKTENAHTANKMTPSGVGDTMLLKELRFTDASRFVFSELNSGLFLWFLFKLTGTEHLMPDPYFVEGGYHCVGNGGRLGVHADFSHHPYYRTERRLNLLLYLNPEWRAEWGGGLQLFDERLRPSSPILPVLNRAVIFETSATSYHGHPQPMTLPPGVWRKSIALYYYSPPRETRERKSAVFPVAA